MSLYDALGADDQRLVDGQVDRLLADPVRIPAELRQEFAGNDVGLRKAMREQYSTAFMVDLLKQQSRAEGLSTGVG